MIATLAVLTAGVLAAVAAAAAVWTVPRWLPAAVVRVRERIFVRINGVEGIPVPGPLVGAEHFERIYSDPAADGRSRGAGLSDLFWYWLAPGPQMHQEHLEPGERYTAVARTTRRVLAVPHRRCDDLATTATRRRLDDLPPGRTTAVRLRDLMMPVWAEVFYELVFGEPCPATARDLIVANADDVVTALKATGLRHMKRRDRLTRYLLGRIADGTCPVTLPGFSAQETAWYLQGAFFNTAVVQMSEAMAHILLCAAQYPTPSLDDDALDRFIDETLRVHPLFGIAHRITSAPIVVDEQVTLPTGSVLLFNYLAYQRTGPAPDDTFDPDRWLALPRREAHFIPYGITANRACPARGGAPVMLRAATREVLRRFALASAVEHTRSLPSRGPAYLTPFPAAGPALAGPPRTGPAFATTAPGPAAPAGPSRAELAAQRLRDRWAGVGRSLQQLVLGTWMVVDARRQRLCAHHFAPTSEEADL